MYELIIIWETGEKEKAQYKTEEEAKQIEKGLYIAFGRQIQFTCINKIK